jgi:hypothetical protein
MVGGISPDSNRVETHQTALCPADEGRTKSERTSRTGLSPTFHRFVVFDLESFALLALPEAVAHELASTSPPSPPASPKAIRSNSHGFLVCHCLGLCDPKWSVASRPSQTRVETHQTANVLLTKVELSQSEQQDRPVTSLPEIRRFRFGKFALLALPEDCFARTA